MFTDDLGEQQERAVYLVIPLRSCQSQPSNKSSKEASPCVTASDISIRVDVSRYYILPGRYLSRCRWVTGLKPLLSSNVPLCPP